MLKLKMTAQFKKDVKLLKKQGKPLEELNTVISDLCKGKPLARNRFDHALVGNYVGCRECYIQPDWVLVYALSEDELVLTAIRTGSHSVILRK